MPRDLKRKRARKKTKKQREEGEGIELQRSDAMVGNYTGEGKTFTQETCEGQSANAKSQDTSSEGIGWSIQHGKGANGASKGGTSNEQHKSRFSKWIRKSTFSISGQKPLFRKKRPSSR